MSPQLIGCLPYHKSLLDVKHRRRKSNSIKVYIWQANSAMLRLAKAESPFQSKLNFLVDRVLAFISKAMPIDYTQSQTSALTGYILNDPQTLKDL
ncbi:MAG: hypothetical protein MUE44_32230 [Oscillatoriaceae cyanobacterium Prado104]|jgi:hypothetical protein|nr:hypothetical protein [Oscillatoriaceae cyanobacterium Prado104]